MKWSASFVMNWLTTPTRPHAVETLFVYSAPISGRREMIPVPSAESNRLKSLRTLEPNAESQGPLCTAQIIILGVTGLITFVVWHNILQLIATMR